MTEQSSSEVAAALVDPTSLLHFDFGPGHPFKIYRLGLCYELLRAYGLTDLDGVLLLEPREATEEEAGVFHSQGYLETLRLASSGMWVPNLFAHGLGTPDNPVFPDVYDWAMSVAGASIECAEAIASGRVERAFNMTGGLHHAMPSRASGFCHINDIVLAIHALLAKEKRVAYVDIDAHHGDGVEHAFFTRHDVLTVSVHQSGYTIFPGSGFVEEIGDGPGRGYALNVPLQPGAGDEAYDRAFEEVVFPALDLYKPDVLATQFGADAVYGDAVANLRMSPRCFERSVRRFHDLGLPWLAFGGGGYDVGNVVRAWTLVWGAMVGADLPDEIPVGWSTQAASYGVSISSLRGDTEATPTSPAALEDLENVIERLRSTVLPILHEAA